MTSRITTDGSAYHRSCRGRGVVTTPTSKLVPDDSTDDRAEKRAATLSANSASISVVSRILPALLDRSPDGDVVNDGL